MYKTSISSRTVRIPVLKLEAKLRLKADDYKQLINASSTYDHMAGVSISGVVIRAQILPGEINSLSISGGQCDSVGIPAESVRSAKHTDWLDIRPVVTLGERQLEFSGLVQLQESILVWPKSNPRNLLKGNPDNVSVILTGPRRSLLSGIGVSIRSEGPRLEVPSGDCLELNLGNIEIVEIESLRTIPGTGYAH